jgi:3-hydroxyisobutyrate dehydrogenase-like beta-hydroxyacid dehydrogenase
MDKKHIGFLHPGDMGISLAATAQNSGYTACWVSKDRSLETCKRAARHSLVDMQTIEELCGRCSVIISVCPPHAATAVAEQVLACSFKGVYADVNAVSPERTKRIGQSMTDAGVEFVDGGIIGGPAWSPQATWLYLSGRAADQVAACFAGGPLEVEIIGDEIGRASALKMCFAAYLKGTTALMCATVAAAEGMGVRSVLEKHWSRKGSDFAESTLNRIRQVTQKAWRFSGEMDEIASTFETAGIPGGFHRAAGEIFDRIARFKGADPIPPVEDVLDALLGSDIQSKGRINVSPGRAGTSRVKHSAR